MSNDIDASVGWSYLSKHK